MITWPQELITDIARRRCVLYLGSGVSASSLSSDDKKHPPTWDTFIRNVVSERQDELKDEKDLINNLLKSQDFLTACEIIVDKLGDADFGELAADEFRRPGYKPTEIHDVIYGLDSRLVITPNIDKIYEQCANTNSHGTVVTKKYYEDIAPFLRKSDYLVIKAHGCVDEPSKIVFTHKQYNIARYNYASFYRLMDSLMLTNTFIFLGCGFADPDIQLTLENSNFSFPNCKPHYFITSDGSIPSSVAKTLFNNRNIRVLTYDNSDGSHSNLQLELMRLSDEVYAERAEIAQNASW